MNEATLSTTKAEVRNILHIAGDDAESFLQGLVTNGPLKDGAAFSALLTPQGKILYDFFLMKQDGEYLLDCHREAAAALMNRLTLYKLRAKVNIGLDAYLSVSTNKAFSKDGIPFEDPRTKILGDRIVTTLGPVGADYHTKRIAAGIPEWGADFSSDEVFLMDVNYDLLNGVDYKKGCFVGQEVASRMKRKGEARKRTLIAEFNGAPPEKGTPVMAGASTLGHIMSGVDGAALALIRLDRWEIAKSAGEQIAAGDKVLRLKLPDYMQQD